jgi:tetratricopeptide (TPR) repeat protein
MYYRRTRSKLSAIRAFEEALEVSPNRGMTHSALGFELQRSGDVDRALVHLRKALEYGERASVDYTTLANPHVKRGELDEAEKLVRETIRSQPGWRESWWARGLLAILHALRDDWSSAEDVIHELTELSPPGRQTTTREYWWVLMGRYLSDRWYTEHSAQAFRKALQDDPDSAVANLALTWLLVMNPELHSEGGAAEAVRLAERGLASLGANVNRKNLLGHLGAAQLRAAQYEAAAATLEEVVSRPELLPRARRAQYPLFLAMPYAKLGRRADAQSRYEEGVAAMERVPEALKDETERIRAEAEEILRSAGD